MKKAMNIQATKFACLLILILIVGCSDHGKSKSTEIDSSNNQTLKLNEGNNPTNTVKKRALLNPDFLSLSKLSKEASFGILQGVNNTDSAGPYVSREYYGDRGY